MHVLTCTPRPERTTTIVIGAGARSELPDRIAASGAGRPVLAILDHSVTEHHADLVPATWRQIPLPGGEACKSFATLESVLSQMARWELDRGTIVVAIGGGAVGDLSGLAASLFLRGVDLVQVPTTLLAMLDSSVGGKTAINVPEGKNLVGTFWPPTLMLADLDFAKTLPRDQLLSGLGEALKMGIGFSSELFDLLEANAAAILDADPDLLTQVVLLAVRAKIETVESDPFETTGRRQRLNLGHTLGHALEAMSGYSMPHGLAVAQGLHFALEHAAHSQTMPPEPAARCHALLELYGFAREPIADRSPLLSWFMRDKKMRDGLLHMVLPTAIGACATFPTPPADLI